MTATLTFRNFIVLALVSALFVQIDPVSLVTGVPVSSEAIAKVGQPLTPGSAAGVARRTIRRTSIYVRSLPAGCVKISVNGVSVWHCGTRYYQYTGSQYVVIHIN